jgi:hypothetical protein
MVQLAVFSNNFFCLSRNAWIVVDEILHREISEHFRRNSNGTGTEAWKVFCNINTTRNFYQNTSICCNVSNAYNNENFNYMYIVQYTASNFSQYWQKCPSSTVLYSIKWITLY